MPSIQQWGRDFEEKPVTTLLKGGVSVLVIFGILAACIFSVRMACFPVNQAAKVAERTFGADNVIYNYEYFHNAYEDVQAIDGKIEVAKNNVTRFENSAGLRQTWTFEDKNEYSRLHSVLQGLESQREDIVADYNAHSKMVNRKIFKDGNLPERLE